MSRADPEAHPFVAVVTKNLSRRSYLAAAAGGAALALSRAGAGALPAGGSPGGGPAAEQGGLASRGLAAHPLRLAHVGFALDGSWSFLKQALAAQDATMAAVVDTDAARLAKAAKAAPMARPFADLNQMLDEVRPDAVLATLPNDQHLPLVRACAKRKVHVWMQKPMAATWAQAKEMQSLAARAGIKLMIQWFRLWSPAEQAVAALIASGALGPIQRVVWSDGYGEAHEHHMSDSYRASFWDPSREGGGALIEQGTYGIHKAVWILGRPTRVFATARKLRAGAPFSSEDEAWAVLDYPQATAIVQGAWSMPDVGGAASPQVIAGTKGVVRGGMGTFTLHRGGDPTPPPEPLTGGAPPPERANGVAHFVDCMRNDREIDWAHAAALNVLVAEVTEAAYRSIRAGRPVALPPGPSRRLSP